MPRLMCQTHRIAIEYCGCWRQRAAVRKCVASWCPNAATHDSSGRPIVGPFAEYCAKHAPLTDEKDGKR